jgi:hypothetical protein
MTQSSTLSRNFPTLRYLAAPFRWFFRSRRRVWTTASVLLAMIAAPVLWWLIQLVGLPDIGEPFDVEAFRSFRIPDERNAFVLYQQAAQLLKPLDPTFKWSPWNPYRDTPRPKSVAAACRRVEANREAMALFRRGAERPDALDLVPPTDPRWWRMIEALWWFHELAQLKAGRLEQEGDMAGAWGWYRTDLRASYHMSLRGTAAARINALRQHSDLRSRLAMWAADRRTTPALLRQALDDVVACGAFRPSETYTLQAEYLQLEQSLLGQTFPGRNGPRMRLHVFFKKVGLRPEHEQIEAMVDAWRWWRREPERSRRLLRLVFADWLAYESLPADRRPDPDDNRFGDFEFHAFGPEAPENARALPPAALVRWLNAAIDIPELFNWWQLIRGFGCRRYWLNTRGPSERAGHRELVILLARHLYLRDHGSYAPSEQALVGPYLKELPDDGSGDAGGAARSR